MIEGMENLNATQWRNELLDIGVDKDRIRTALHATPHRLAELYETVMTECDSILSPSQR